MTQETNKISQLWKTYLKLRKDVKGLEEYQPQPVGNDRSYPKYTPFRETNIPKAISIEEYRTRKRCEGNVNLQKKVNSADEYVPEAINKSITYPKYIPTPLGTESRAMKRKREDNNIMHPKYTPTQINTASRAIKRKRGAF